MRYDFDTIIDRRDTNSVKYDLRGKIFGKEDVLPMWVADMDFPVADAPSSARMKDGTLSEVPLSCS